MRGGRVLQCAPPLDLYARPADLFTATFVGSPRMNLWRGTRREGGFHAPGLDVALPALPGEGDLWLGIRPEDVRVSTESAESGWPARLEQAEPLGDRLLLTLRVGDTPVRALAAPRDYPAAVRLVIPPERLHWFDAATERRLESGSRP
jgi:multiple sugar transport system ATP-binding protein